MATSIPVTNVSMSSIQSVLGGSNPISLSEYYAGGAYTPSGTQSPVDPTPVPSSGTIRIGEFRGITNNPVVQGIIVNSRMSNAPAYTTNCFIRLNSDGTISNGGSSTGGGAIHGGGGNTFWITPNGGSNNYSSVYSYVITAISGSGSTGTYSPTATGSFGGNVSASAGPNKAVTVTYTGNIVLISTGAAVGSFSFGLSLDNT